MQLADYSAGTWHVLLRAFLVWAIVLVLANVNGGVRELWLIPRIGPNAGHVLSTLLLAMVVLAVAWKSVQWIGVQSLSETMIAGTMWLVLTLAFEFGAGHFLFRKPWSELVADYNVSAGRIWIIIPIVTLFALEIARRFRQDR